MKGEIILKKLKIVINSIEPVGGSDSGIWGNICIKNGQSYFPFADWSDIISSILCLWLDAIKQFISTNFKEKCELFFMDGPYEMEFIPRDNLITALFCEGNCVLMQEESIDFDDFVKQLINISHRFLNEFQKFSSNRALKEVRVKLDILEKYLAITGFAPT